MEYKWDDRSYFLGINIPLEELSIKVLNHEIYEDRDNPNKKNFKHPWFRHSGVDVEYVVNKVHIQGARGKTIWYIPARFPDAAKALNINLGQALKIVKYPVNDNVIVEYERLLHEFTIQKVLNKYLLAPDIYKLILIKNTCDNNVIYFNENYHYHKINSIYFATVVEDLISEEFPKDGIYLDKDFMFYGKLIEEFLEKCKQIRIKPYDLGLGNILFSQKKGIQVVDVHKWTWDYSIKIPLKPKYLQFELNNTCNAKCMMCTIPHITRARGCMGDALFQKILREAEELKIEYLIPFLHGEPFLRNDFVDKLTLINDYVPDAKIIIFTNASLLTEEKIEKLKKIRNIARLNLSFPGGNKNTYQKVTGLDFDTSVKNIKHALESLSINMKITMPKFIGNEDSEMDFLDLWHGYNAYAYNTYNYLGHFTNSLSPTTYYYCDRMIRSMTVLWDGRVCLCCMDAEGEYVLGDVSKGSIYDVWNGPIAQKYKRNHLVSRLYCEPCNLCNQNLLPEEH